MAGKKKVDSSIDEKKKKETTKSEKKTAVSKKAPKKKENKKEITPENVKENTRKIRVSRVQKNQDIYVDDFTITKEEQIYFDENRLDDEESLDNTFVETRLKKQKKKVITPRKEEEEFPVKKKSRASVVVIIILSLLFLASLGTNIFVFATKPTKTKIKTVTKTVVKKAMDDNYVFLGDSITDGYDLNKYFEGYPVVNSGVNGNTTTDILKDMEGRVYRYNPTKLFLLIGTNDLKKMDQEEIISNIHKIIDEIQEHRPYCEIYLESIYPVNNTEEEKIDHDMVTEDRKNEDIEEINEALEKIAEEEKITYLDLYSLLVDEEGNLNLDYTTEGLHISDEGYALITEEIMKYIKK